MNIYALWLVQLMLIAAMAAMLHRRRLGFYSGFYGAMLVLVILPSHLIFADLSGVINIVDTFGRTADAKVGLALGDGVRGIRVVMAFQLLYVAVGFFAPEGSSTVMASSYKFDPAAYTRVAAWLFGIAAVYTAVRYFYVPDFPLFHVLKGGGAGMMLRDVAYEYATNANDPYIFRPSINSQFYRILMPLAALMMLTGARARQSDQLRVWAYLFVLVTAVMSIGSFKRMPIVLVILWFFFNRYMYQSWTGMKKVFALVLVVFLVTLAITAQYSTQTTLADAFANLTWRAFLGEAIGQFLALEHFGTTFPYMYFEIPLTYAQKVLGQDVQTFSEMWKVRTGGLRGFTSVGMMVEIFVSFGPWLSLPFFAAIPMVLLQLDRVVQPLSENAALRPVIAGLMVVVSFMSVKGFASQSITGGGMTLFLVLLLLLRMGRLHEGVAPVGRRPLPLPSDPAALPGSAVSAR